MQAVEKTIREKLTEFVETDHRNAMPAHNGMRIYDSPLIGFAAADDSMFETLTAPEIFGTQLIRPGEWLSGAKTVISFFLPFTQEVRASNRVKGLPSEEWVSARIDGEAFIRVIQTYLVEFFKTLDAGAVAPSLDSRFSTQVPRPGEVKISNWSERHTAHIAGLGTFGLHRALITEKGSAGRFGSVVTTLAISPTERKYSGPFDYCPYLTKGKCGACISRCPAEAIVDGKKDNLRCSAYVDMTKEMFKPRYGCAKCNIAVPCETGIPKI